MPTAQSTCAECLVSHSRTQSSLFYHRSWPRAVNMPEMVAQTNMDVQSVNRLREEISRLCTWLARNSGRFFCAKYEKPTAEYIEGAR